MAHEVRAEDHGGAQLEGMTFSNLLVADLMMRMEEADIFEARFPHGDGTGDGRRKQGREASR